jgi:hypothetical protein
MKVTTRKATRDEQDAYADRYPLRPTLWGYATYNGHTYEIDRDGKAEYEVNPPDGMHFIECNDTHCDACLHSLVCFDLADVRDRIPHYPLATCAGVEA